MQQNQPPTPLLTPEPSSAAPVEAAPPRQRLWPAMGWWKHLLVVLLLAGVVGGSFANSYKSGMVLDNRYIIEEYYKTVLHMNPRLNPESMYQVALIFQNDYWWPKGISGLYRPITTLSYWVDYIWLTGKAPKVDSRGNPIRAANGALITPEQWEQMSWNQYVDFPGNLNTTSYHTINLAIHLINAMLVYFVALMLTQRFWPSAMIAALFAAHPITTESVTNIIGRADMLAAVAVFGGLLLYVRATRSTGARAWPWLVGLMVLTAFGVFSKESSAAIVLAIIAYDVAYRWRFGNPELRGFPPLLLHGVLYLIFAAVTLGLPLLASWISQRLALAEGLPPLACLAIEGAAAAIGLIAYAVLMRQPRPLRIAALGIATVAFCIGAVFLPYFGMLPAAIVAAVELARGSLTSSDPRFRAVAHSVLYLTLFFAILFVPFAGIWAADHWRYDEWFLESQDFIQSFMTPIWLRYVYAIIAFAAGLFIHFYTVGRSWPVRLCGLIVALGASFMIGMWSYWLGMLLGMIVAVHEVLAGSFVPRSPGYRRDWRMIWSQFALGYVVMIPPLIAMFLTRAWVFANSTPAEEPFLDNPIRGIWKVAELNIPSFAEELAKKPMYGVSFFECKMTAVKVMGKLLYLLAWPRTLCSDYSYAQIPNFSITFHNGFEDVKALVALVVVFAIFIVLPVLVYRRSKAALFFILFFFVAALPTSNLLITIGSVMAERFMYLPLAGFTGVLVLGVYAGISRLVGWLKLNHPDDFQWAPLVASLLLPIIVAVYGIRAYERNFAWQSDYTLWSDAMATNPLSFRSHQSLAFAVFEKYIEGTQQGRSPAQLEPLVDRMIAIDESARPIVDPLPNHLNSSRLYLHLGMYYSRKAETQSKTLPDGQRQVTPESTVWLKKAIDALEYGVQVDRAFNEVNRARSLRRGDKPEAIPDAGLPTIYNLVGNAYGELGDFDRAYRRFVYARHLEPKEPDTYFSIFRVKVKSGRLDDATIAILEALIIAPDRLQGQDPWGWLAKLYANRGPGGANALVVNDGRPQLNLSGNTMVQEDLLGAYRDLIRVLRRSLRFDQAWALRNQAVRGHQYPPEAIDPLFNEPIEVVTPDGLQIGQVRDITPPLMH
jgi:tetratricopeptide (TPR) repeat protein